MPSDSCRSSRQTSLSFAPARRMKMPKRSPFASEAASYVNGAELFVDGGFGWRLHTARLQQVILAHQTATEGDDFPSPAVPVKQAPIPLVSCREVSQC